MKYILTESQLKFLTESQQYLNILLDKISQSGMDSLSDKEKESLIRISKGETIYDEEPEQSTEVDTFNADGFFLHFSQYFNEIQVGDTQYNINVTDDCVEVHNDNFLLHIEPRFDDRKIVFRIDNIDEEKSWNLPSVPEGEEQMRIFVLKFYNKQLPKIIESLV